MIKWSYYCSCGAMLTADPQLAHMLADLQAAHLASGHHEVTQRESVTVRRRGQPTPEQAGWVRAETVVPRSGPSGGYVRHDERGQKVT